MKTTWQSIVVCLALCVAACSGDKGATGPAGNDGSNGPPGPITTPPALTSLAPTWGSVNTQITINGTGFSTTASDNHVYFDGHAATVLTASATQLVVTPGVATDGSEQVVVDVEVADQVSNALAFELVASGSAHYLDVALPSAPTSTVAVGTDVYIASGVNGVARTGGLFKLSGGVVTQVVPAHLVTLNTPNGPLDIVDGPVAVAAYNGDVYYTTTFGEVRRYKVSTGAVDVVFSLPSPAGNAFPARTGLVFDAGGDLYIVDRNLPGVIRVHANGTLAGIGTAAGIYGIASDGTDLYISNDTADTISKISNLATTPTVTTVATTTVPLRGIAVVGANVIVSDDAGHLGSVAKTGGSLASFGDPAGYKDPIVGLSVLSGDLLLAQPAGVVRSKPAASNPATVIAAGVRFAFAMEAVGGKWYASTDGAVVEIDPAGASRVVAAGSPVGLVASGAGALTISDCAAARVYTLDIASGTQTDRLTSSNFSGVCPVGLAIDSNADLFYIESPGGTIGKLSGTTQTPGYATGISATALRVVLSNGALYTSGFTAATRVDKVSTAGGAASALVQAGVADTLTLTVAPDGTLVGVRLFTGEVIHIDTTTGAVTPFGSTVPPTTAYRASVAGGAAFAADGTLTVMDAALGDVVAIAP